MLNEKTVETVVMLSHKKPDSVINVKAEFGEGEGQVCLPMYDVPNAVEELKQTRKHPTPEKVEAIKDALKHFEII